MWLVCASAAVVDRVAVVVGNDVITEREVLDEVRVTEFLNNEPLDLGPDQRKAAAERLIDQNLIRKDMQIGGYRMPDGSEADKMLANLKKERFHSDQEYRAALARYGITEDDLKRHLRWQLAVMRFTDIRFNPSIPQEPPLDTANREQPGAEAPSANGVDRLLEAWLARARNGVRIEYKKDAFQ